MKTNYIINNTTVHSASTISYSNNNPRFVEEYEIGVSNEENSIVDTEKPEYGDYSEVFDSYYSRNDNYKCYNTENKTENNFHDSKAIWALKEKIPLKSV